MKPYFIKDDDGNYLNPNYLFHIQVIRYCNLGSLLAFEAIKKAKTYEDLGSTKYIDTPDVYQWMENFHKKIPNFEEENNSYDCENLKSFEISDLLPVEIHTSLDIDKISHINTIYENDIFQYFEIVYIDSDQLVIKGFESEKLAQAWIAEHFEII